MYKPMKTRPAVLALLGLVLAACAPAQGGGQPAGPAVTGEAAVVDAVGVEIGVGSPIPVWVVIDSSFPDTCAQLTSVQQRQAGSTFELTVLTTPADPDNAACASPMGALPFRFEVPLNAVGLEPGTYTVTVNGTSTTFAYPPAAH